jgi:type I restriction enzyme R subunit
MIEFKQIIGRGTRLFEDKFYFTIVDFVGAYKKFSDPDWDGPGLPPGPPKPPPPPQPPKPPPPPKEKIIIKLAKGNELSITSMSTTLFYFQKKPISVQEFIKKLFNTITLPEILKNEEQLRELWSSPITRNKLFKKLEDEGFAKQDLKSIQTLIEAEDSDIFDVLVHVAYSKKPIRRTTRVANAEEEIYKNLNDNQKEFIDFVLSKYVEGGVEELDINRLSSLVELKYKSLHDGQKALGDADKIKSTFIDFQKHLY